jgi:hypothetical protein
MPGFDHTVAGDVFAKLSNVLVLPDLKGCRIRANFLIFTWKNLNSIFAHMFAHQQITERDEQYCD